MYLSLIDTVSKIVKTYGVDILSSPKFWHVLSDSYSFGNEYALKDIFKSCLTTGYISKLVAIKGNSKKTKAEIAHIVDSENRINPGKEKEYSAVLYSIAIAIGSCSKKDYSDYINRNNQQSTPSPRPKRSKNKKQRNNCLLSDGWTYIWGICAVMVSAGLFNLPLFYGFPLWALIIILGIVQLSFCSYLLRLESNQQNDKIKSFAIPIIIVFFLIDCISLGLTIFKDLHVYLWAYLSGRAGLIGLDDLTYSAFWIWAGFNEVGGIFSFLLTLLLLFCVASCLIGTISNQFSLKRLTISVDKGSIFLSSTIILLIFASCWSIYYYENATERENYIKRQEDIDSRNHRIQCEQKNREVDLSFKGIKLGIDFSTCLGYADSLFYSKIKVKPDYELIEVKSWSNLPSYFTRAIVGNIQWDNQIVKLSVMEYNNKVGEIKVEPEESYINSFYDYPRVINLYTMKYGEPQKEIWSPMLRYFKECGIIDKPYDWTYYRWSFKNGRIDLSNNSIVYQSETVTKHIEEIEIKEQHEKEIRQRQIEREQQIADSIEFENKKLDSLKIINNHKNAINEI